MRQFAISDIHGCAATFKSLLESINFSESDELYLLGDYIDRGPDSKGVIDHIWALQESGYTIFCLKGNHEQMMINAFGSLQYRRSWLTHGGATTVESFDIDYMSDIPKKYTSWMKGLPHYIETKDYLLVHAGFNFGNIDPLEDKHSMIWTRRWYQTLNRDWLGDRIIIHGHTPIPKTEIEKRVLQLEELPVMDIDAGCTFVEDEYGWLCAFELGTKELFFEKRLK